MIQNIKIEYNTVLLTLLLRDITVLKMSQVGFAEFSLSFGESKCDIFELLDLEYKGYKLFNRHINNALIYPKFIEYVKSITNFGFTWKSLTNKPDYNLYRFKYRDWPYFSIDSEISKEWINIVLESGYPSKETDNADRSEVEEDALYTNFSAYEAVDPSKYVNIFKLTLMLSRVKALGIDILPAAQRLMMNPDTVHIIKNALFWEIVGDLDKKHINYGLYYSLYILRHEETVLFSKITRNHRSVFTHDEALLLPNYDFNINVNPHIQQLTDCKYISSTIPYHVNGGRRLTTQKEFKRRFHFATGGCLMGIDLASMKAAVSGSILVPCASVSPLENNFNALNWEARGRVGDAQIKYWEKTKLTLSDRRFLEFIEFYYPGYHSLLPADLKKAYSEPTFKKESFMSEEKEEIMKKPGYNQIADMDISISASTVDEFAANANKIYELIKLNCAHRGEVYLIKIETISSFKYCLSGPGLIRPIDIFQIYYDPVRMTKRFHLDCVKMWFEGVVGKNGGLFLHRSCISCLLSGVNERYSWFSCNKIPADIILKYALRGFSTILNTKEIASLEMFMRVNPRWRVSEQKITGSVSWTNEVFTSDTGIRFGLEPYMLKFEKSNHVVPLDYLYELHDGVSLLVKSSDSVSVPRPLLI